MLLFYQLQTVTVNTDWYPDSTLCIAVMAVFFDNMLKQLACFLSACKDIKWVLSVSTCLVLYWIDLIDPHASWRIEANYLVRLVTRWWLVSSDFVHSFFQILNAQNLSNTRENKVYMFTYHHKANANQAIKRTSLLSKNRKRNTFIKFKNENNK